MEKRVAKRGPPRDGANSISREKVKDFFRTQEGGEGEERGRYTWHTTNLKRKGE